MKKHLTIATALLALSANAVFAEDTATVAQNNDSMYYDNGSTQKTSTWQDDDMYGISLRGEALFWKTTVETFSYTESVNNNSSSTLPDTGTKRNVNFDWDWGYRVGAGYDFLENEWGLDLAFTRFSSKARNRAQADYLVIPASTDMLNTIGTNPAYASNVSAHFDNTYTALDGKLMRRFNVGDLVRLYPFFGVKGAWFDQKQTNTFTGENLASDTNYVRKYTYSFDGAGPKVGTCSKWAMACGFSWYANCAASLLFGDSKGTFKESYSLGSDYKTTYTSVTNRTVPALEMDLGLEYLYRFQDVAQMLGVKIGFNGEYFFNQYQSMNTTVDSQNFGGLGFYGVNLGAFWMF